MVVIMFSYYIVLFSRLCGQSRDRFRVTTIYLEDQNRKNDKFDWQETDNVATQFSCISFVNVVFVSLLLEKYISTKKCACFVLVC